MSFGHSHHFPSFQNCEWCNQQRINPHTTINCKHKICDQCILNDKSCQSNCPLCWYNNSGVFIYHNKICSGKINNYFIYKKLNL